jgi:hypothetical protein
MKFRIKKKFRCGIPVYTGPFSTPVLRRIFGLKKREDVTGGWR